VFQSPSAISDRLVEEVEKIRFEKKVKLGYGISGNPAVIHEWGRRGRISFPHQVSYMARIRDIGLHLEMRPIENAALMSAGFKTLDNLNKLRQAFKQRTKSNNDFELVEIQHFADNTDVFWAEIQKHYNFILDKSSQFLNWRYCDPRAGRFIVKQAIKDSKVFGYIVSELREDDEYSEGFIDDLLALPGRLDVVHALLDDSCSYFDDLNVNVVHYMVVRGHPYQEISSRNGFLDSHRTPYITCQIIDAEKDFEVLKASSPSQVHFTHSDSL